MSFTPIIVLMLMFWWYTNQQMFDNKIDKIHTQDEIILSHHIPTDVKWKLLTQDQKLLLFGLIACSVAVLIHEISIKKFKNIFKSDYRSTRHQLMPDYFQALKNHDAEEFIDEEYEFRKLGYKSLEEDVLHKFKEIADQDISSRSSDEEEDHKKDVKVFPTLKRRSQQSSDKSKMVGNPCYNVFSAMDYQMEFNNQNLQDEMNTKLLLMLPMIPRENLHMIKLNHLKLYKTGTETNLQETQEIAFRRT